MKPDAIRSIHREETQITVHLAMGGDRFPWAVCNGRVVIGPPDGTLTSDGVPLDSLEWSVDYYWVIDAMDAKGNPVSLTPEEYAFVVQNQGLITFVQPA